MLTGEEINFPVIFGNKESAKEFQDYMIDFSKKVNSSFTELEHYFKSQVKNLKSKYKLQDN